MEPYSLACCVTSRNILNFTWWEDNNCLFLWAPRDWFSKELKLITHSASPIFTFSALQPSFFSSYWQHWFEQYCSLKHNEHLDFRLSLELLHLFRFELSFGEYIFFSVTPSFFIYVLVLYAYVNNKYYPSQCADKLQICYIPICGITISLSSSAIFCFSNKLYELKFMQKHAQSLYNVCLMSVESIILQRRGPEDKSRVRGFLMHMVLISEASICIL